MTGLEVTLPEAKEPDIVPENIPLDILYEDQDIIMINKPKQMVVHPAPGHYSGTLVNALMYTAEMNCPVSTAVCVPELFNRIDMDTTGSLVICKNDKSSSEPFRNNLKGTLYPSYLCCNRTW